MTAAERPIIEATDRSISPLMMTNAITRTTIAFSMPSWNRLIWFVDGQVVRGRSVTFQVEDHEQEQTSSSPSQPRSRLERATRHGRPRVAVGLAPAALLVRRRTRTHASCSRRRMIASAVTAIRMSSAQDGVLARTR